MSASLSGKKKKEKWKKSTESRGSPSAENISSIKYCRN